MNKKEAKELFDNMIIEDECLEWGLTEKYISRPYSIEQISENEFIIEIERHPHLFGRSSIGFNSSAFATVIQKFKLETTTPKVSLMNEEVIDIDIDYEFLAEEDFSSEFYDWWITDEDKAKLEGLKTKEEVESFAVMLFNKIDLVETNKTFYESDYKLPEDFYSRILEAQKEVLKEKVIQKWEHIKNMD